MQTKIIGTTLPALEITLEPGEKIISEPGELSWMTGNMTLHTTTATGGVTGIWGAVKRALGGDGLFLAQLTGPGTVWLQTLTMPNLAHALLPYLVTDARTDGAATSVAAVAGAGIAGALIEGLLKGGSREA